MAFAGRLHPLLVHFPIALLLLAVIAEFLSLALRDARWRFVASVSLRAGAVSAVATAAAGWLLAAAGPVEPTVYLEWHRWLGTAVAVLATTAALAAYARATSLYRVSLFTAGALLPVAGHLGAVLVWGADFLRF
jgi:uncharacterized membrane protein